MKDRKYTAPLQVARVEAGDPVEAEAVAKDALPAGAKIVDIRHLRESTWLVMFRDPGNRTRTQRFRG